MRCRDTDRLHRGCFAPPESPPFSGPIPGSSVRDGRAERRRSVCSPCAGRPPVTDSPSQRRQLRVRARSGPPQMTARPRQRRERYLWRRSTPGVPACFRVSARYWRNSGLCFFGAYRILALLQAGTAGTRVRRAPQRKPNSGDPVSPGHSARSQQVAAPCVVYLSIRMRLRPLHLPVAPMSATHPMLQTHRGCGAGLHVDAGPILPSLHFARCH